MFPIIKLYESNAYVINHVNLALSKKILNSNLILSKKTMSLVRILYKVGCIYKYSVLKQYRNATKPGYIIRFSVFFYKNKPFFKGVKLVSTGSRKVTISYNALRLTDKFLKSSTLVLSTSKGIITHREALRYKIGGLIICSIS